MNSRQRVRALLDGRPTDRVPNGLAGCETAGLHIRAYDKLQEVLGLKDRKTRMYTFMTNAVGEPEVLEAMQGDIVVLHSRMCPARLWGEGAVVEWKWQELWGESFLVPQEWQFRTEADGTIWWENLNWKCPPNGMYFDQVPEASDQGLSDTGAMPMPDDYRPSHDIPDEQLRSFEEAAKWLYENTEFSICCGETINSLQLTPGGTTAWWMRLVQDPAAVHEFLSIAVEAGLAQLRLLHQAVGSYADMLMIADDIGDGRGVTIGPDLWRSVYKPHYKRLFSEWHEITSMKVSLHCCGAISEILDDLIECGVDVINPVQISAHGMEPAGLKKRFGDRIVFYGGAYDAVLTPPSTPPDVVYEAVKSNIKTLRAGGNYIFAGVHNLPGDTPASHLRAILDAYMECR